MISTHILDTSKGDPAKDVRVTLEKHNDGRWELLSEEKTNADGRIAFEVNRDPAEYRLIFDIDQYFEKQNQEAFFPNAQVTFRVKDTKRNYHVPLLLNPYGYSTYRGS